MNHDELIHTLGAQVVADADIACEGWAHLVLTGRVASGTSDMTGFCYTADGTSTPVAPGNFDVFDTLEQLRDAMAEADGKAPWSACLLRIDRTTGKISVDFEYRDATRWAITPANVAARAREFAPG
jgi:hypothetical protein